MLTVFLFLVVLAVLVLVHEAGHALVARLIGCRVEEFAVGFPPRVWGRRVGETVYTVNLIPLGGFVRIAGEDQETDDPRSFSRRPRVAQAAVLVAGVVMNVLLAVLCFTVIAGVGSDVPVPSHPSGYPLTDRRVEVVQVNDTPVLRDAGIHPRDVLTRVQGQEVTTAEAAAAAIREFRGTTLVLTLRRGDTEHTTRVTLPDPHVPGEPIGLGLLDVGTYRVPWWSAPWEGIRATGRTVIVTLSALGRLVAEGVATREFPKDVAGPVGIASIVGIIGRQGVLPLLELVAVLSVNLAIINILPIPALDGGRVLFLLLDAFGIRGLRGKPERLAHAIGFALLIALVALITIKDIQRLVFSTPFH